MNHDEFIERRIVLGLIASTEFIREIDQIWTPELLEDGTATMLALWCFDHFHKFREAPKDNIQDIYVQKLKKGLTNEQAEHIEFILEGLSGDFENHGLNIEYLLQSTKDYFDERSLTIHSEEIQEALRTGDLIEAKQIAYSYKPKVMDQHSSIDPLSSPSVVKKAFEEHHEPLIKFPKALGQFLNSAFTQDSFVALMGREKIGKTYFLMELAFRSVMCGNPTVFFQAGDMTENQQIRRFGIYLSKKSDKQKYCNGLWIPTLDCWKQQTDECEREERECHYSLWKGEKIKERKDLTIQRLVAAAKNEPDYVPCRNCQDIKGSPWLKWEPGYEPLNWTQAYRSMKMFRKKHQARFKLSTHANGTLSLAKIKSLLEIWERSEDFAPTVLIIDYMDLLDSDPDCKQLDGRNQINKIWQRARGLSEERHCLVIGATLADAKSYDAYLLKLSNFSEDKRKYAHATDFIGMNQTDEQKKIGLLRLNRILSREDEFSEKDQIWIMQRLQKGRPFLGSFR
jgi:hypothetical protein